MLRAAARDRRLRARDPQRFARAEDDAVVADAHMARPLRTQAGTHMGRHAKLTPEQAVALRQRSAAGESKVALAEKYGISRATLYATLKNAAGAAAFRAELVKVGLVSAA